jgi:uncharacterized iron-regulated membrane protein
MSLTRFNRKTHKWGSIIIALPILIVIISGILLLLRKEFAVIQPPSQKGSSVIPTIAFEMILQKAITVPNAEIFSWQDIDRLDVRPKKGIVKVRAKNGWEIQLDTANGEILQVMYRRSEWIESLHDGTFFHKSANLWLMLPSAIILLTLWLTGLYLFFFPYFRKTTRFKSNKK